MITSETRMRCLMNTKMYLLVAMFLIVCISFTDSLMCYQCAASTSKEACATDTEGMANSSTSYLYTKNCTSQNPNWTRCMIQWMEADGIYKFYQRDCHNGEYFPELLNSKRFYNLPPENETTCDLIGLYTVCYQPCVGDFCNGPVPWPPYNCTDTEDESCRGSQLVVRNQLIVTEILCVFLSFLVIRGILSMSYH